MINSWPPRLKRAVEVFEYPGLYDNLSVCITAWISGPPASFKHSLISN